MAFDAGFVADSAWERRLHWYMLLGSMMLLLCQNSTWVKAQEPASVMPHPTLVVPGQPAPDFVALELAGQMLTLAPYRGRPVLLNFWATWCAPCRRELPILQAVHATQPATGLALLSVNQDVAGSQDMVRAFLVTNGITFPTLLDPEGTIAARYNVVLLPSTVFIDATGILVAVHYGPLSQEQIVRYLARLQTPQE